MKLWSTLTEPLENSILLSAQASLMYKLRSRVKVSGWTWLSNDDDRVESETMFTKAGFGNDYNLKYIDKDDRCVDNDWALGGRQVHLVVIFWQTDRAWTDLEISNVRHVFFHTRSAKVHLMVVKVWSRRRRSRRKAAIWKVFQHLPSCCTIAKPKGKRIQMKFKSQYIKAGANIWMVWNSNAIVFTYHSRPQDMWTLLTPSLVICSLLRLISNRGSERSAKLGRQDIWNYFPEFQCGFVALKCDTLTTQSGWSSEVKSESDWLVWVDSAFFNTPPDGFMHFKCTILNWSWKNIVHLVKNKRHINCLSI